MGFNACELTDRLHVIIHLPGRDGGRWIKSELFINNFKKMNKSKFLTSSQVLIVVMNF